MKEFARKPDGRVDVSQIRGCQKIGVEVIDTVRSRNNGFVNPAIADNTTVNLTVRRKLSRFNPTNPCGPTRRGGNIPSCSEPVTVPNGAKTRRDRLDNRTLQN